MLVRDGETVALPPKALDTLRYLLEHHGELVPKDELMEAVWPETFVEEGALGQNIFRLRRALGSPDDSSEYIETIPRRGYKFVAGVKVEAVGVLSAATRIQPGRHFWKLAAAGVLAAAGIFFTWSRWSENPVRGSNQAAVLRANARLSAISRDGHRAVYLGGEGQGQSLWVVDVATGERSRILGPVPSRFTALTFSPDGTWIYVVVNGALQRLRVSGGPPSKLVDDVDEGPAISSDSASVAIVREDLARGESVVMIGDRDGAHLSRFAVRKLPAYYGVLAWRPDGLALAAAAGDVGGSRNMTVVEIRGGGRAEHAITRQKWASINAVDWLPSGKALVVAASEERWTPAQLWQLSYPDGNVSRITQDFLHYVGVSVAGPALISTAGSSVSTTAFASIDSGASTALTDVPSEGEHDEQPAWLGANRVIYRSVFGGRGEIWRMDENGGNRLQLTRNGCDNHSPAAVPGGHTIAYVSDCDAASTLLRMNSDGTSQTPLWFGRGMNYPSWSPDARWIFFENNESGKPTIWKVSLQDGKAEQVTHHLSRYPSVSPDGRWVAIYYWSERPGAPREIAVLPASRGEPSPIVHLTNDSRVSCVRWTADSTAVLYLCRRQGRAEVWRQPVRGGEPALLTHFGDDHTSYFDVSPDGGRIVCERLRRWSDVVMLQLAN